MKKMGKNTVIAKGLLLFACATVLSNQKYTQAIVTESVYFFDDNEQQQNSVDRSPIILSDIDALTTLQQSCCSSTGSLLDTISNQIESLTVASCCENAITSDQIAAGLIVSVPGVYCVSANAIYDGLNEAIRIASDDVTLDLGGHTITVTNTDYSVIGINILGNNVIVKNGSIVGAPRTIIKTEGNDITLEQLFLQTTNTVTDNCFGVLTNNGTQLTFKNLTVSLSQATPNGFAFLMLKTPVGVADSIHISGGSVGFYLAGSSNWVLSNFLIESCNVLGFAFEGQNKNIIAKNINVIDCLGQSFHVATDEGIPVESILLENCTASNSGDVGFLVRQSDPNALIHSVILRNCVAFNSVNRGFYILGSDTTAFFNVLLDSCVSQGTTNNEGFLISLGSGFTLKDCISSFSGLDGISVINSQRCQLLSCIANNNGNTGILIDTNGCLVQSCIATNNSWDGIFLSASTTDTEIFNCRTEYNGGVGINDTGVIDYIFGNASFFNQGGNFFPGSNGAPITAASTYWANVREVAVS